MIFIDDVDTDELSLKACAYADDAGWKRYGGEAPYEVQSAFITAYADGYRAAIADEKERYQEALRMIEEAHKKEQAMHFATVFAIPTEDDIARLEAKITEQSKIVARNYWADYLKDRK